MFRAASVPANVLRRNSILVLEHATDEEQGRHGVVRNSHPLANKILRFLDSGPGIDPDVRVSKHSRRKNRDPDKSPVAPIQCDHIVGTGQFGGVEFFLVKHAQKICEGGETETNFISKPSMETLPSSKGRV